MLDTYKTMSFDDLADLHENITKILLEKRLEEETLLRQLIQERSGKLGISLESLFTPQKEARAPARIKYRNPENPADTWTGKGKMPSWLKDAMNTSGREKDHYLIEDV